MKKLALTALVLFACGPKNTPPPNPTSTTAFLFASDFLGGNELQAIDVKSRAAGQVLGPEATSSDSLVRAFSETLYLIGRDYVGQNNNVTVLDPKNGYKRVCPDCQWPLGEAVNVQDFWAVSKSKAYLTTWPSSPTVPAYAHRNDVWIMNPLTGEISGYIDLAAALKAQGDDLAEHDTDGQHELSALYADDAHLFVAIGTFDQKTFGLVPSDGTCGLEVGRVAVIDLNTDKVVKVLKLTGSNPIGRFVPEPNTNNLLIATPGSLNTASTDACGGIDRIDQVTLQVKTPAFTEAQLAGSVVSFDLDNLGNGVAFVFTDGDFLNPTYEVTRIQKDVGAVGDPIVAPGAKGFSQPSFVDINDRNEAYVGLPLRTGAKIGMYDSETGKELASPIETKLPPIDVVFFPGPAYSR